MRAMIGRSAITSLTNYGVTKSHPPTREACCHEQSQGKFIPNPNYLPRNLLFPNYPYINNLRHYPDLLGYNELVVIAEKFQGANSRIDIVMAGG
jgi:hypothetical protein